MQKPCNSLGTLTGPKIFKKIDGFVCLHFFWLQRKFVERRKDHFSTMLAFGLTSFKLIQVTIFFLNNFTQLVLILVNFSVYVCVGFGLFINDVKQRGGGG